MRKINGLCRTFADEESVNAVKLWNKKKKIGKFVVFANFIVRRNILILQNVKHSR